MLLPITISDRAPLRLAIFVTALIQLHQPHTVLVLYSSKSTNVINFLHLYAASHDYVAWLMVNQFYDPRSWNHTDVKNQDIMIITAIWEDHTILYFPPLYYLTKLNRRTKNVCLLNPNENPKWPTTSWVSEALENCRFLQINAIFLEWWHSEVIVHAWNPQANLNNSHAITLNDTAFLMAHKQLSASYQGLFFDNIQTIEGSETCAFISCDPKNVYNVISSDGRTRGIDGTEIEIIDILGEAMHSRIEYNMVQVSVLFKQIDANLFIKFVEKSHITHAPIHRRKLKMYQHYVHGGTNWQQRINDIYASGYLTATIFDTLYPHGFENYVIIVGNNRVVLPFDLFALLQSPAFVLWISMLLLFGALRCLCQWFDDTANSVDTTIKRIKCVLICRDTVLLSLGIVLSAKQFLSKKHRHAILVHCTTIIPIIVSMTWSSKLYAELLLDAHVPRIDSFRQLERSGLSICYPEHAELDNVINENETRGLSNTFFQRNKYEMISMIWSGNIDHAYVLPERWLSLLEMDHLIAADGRSIFHVIKERFVGHFVYLSSLCWYMVRRMDTIVMRLNEHGLMNHFESVSRQIVRRKRTQGPKHPVDTSVSLNDISAAGVFYCIGTICGVLVFLIESYSEQTFNCKYWTTLVIVMRKIRTRLVGRLVQILRRQ